MFYIPFFYKWSFNIGLKNGFIEVVLAIVKKILIVVSVSAITLTTVEVTLEAPAETVAAGDFVVSLGEEAITVTDVALKEGTEKTYALTIPSLDGKSGTLTVNSVESSFDFTSATLSAAIDALKSATNETIIGLLNAPVLNIANVNPALAAEYKAEIDSSFTNTRELIQKAVDRVNADATEADQAKVDAVKNAKGPVELLAALDALSIEREIESIAYPYFVAISSNTSINTKADIQGIIDSVNTAEVTKLVVDAEAKVTTEAVATADALLTNFTGTEIVDDVDVAKEAFEARLAVVTDIVAVNDTVSATTVEADLLAALQSETLALGEIVIPANATDYVTEASAKVSADANFKFTTIDQIKTFVNETNAKAAASLITAVNNADTEEAFFTALTAPKLGLTDVSDNPVYKKVYFETGKDLTFKTPADIQAFVTKANEAAKEYAYVDAINNASKSTIVAAVTDFVKVYNNTAYINLSTDNRLEAISTFWVNHGEGRAEAFTTTAEVSQALTDAVTEYQGYLDGINASTNTSELLAAFNVMIDDLEVAYGDELASKVKELSYTEIYDNGSLTIEAATAIFEQLQANRSDDITSNDNFATVAQAYEPAAKLITTP
ncbi:hypothetical protein [Brevibacillus daliensis]|uniref:hypothetical protein n=1 Tax=Brevibacillus daliensis TaxID=2892995 RepID=UPI001E61B8FC|nr:hypothetical protein [Brevibacillus daliensis]